MKYRCGVARRGVATFAAALALLTNVTFAQTPAVSPPHGIELSAAERAIVLAHGPWPMLGKRDASNRFSGNGAAARLGRSLFFDTSLSPDGRFSCASCHLPDKLFSDGLPRGAGRALLPRNTPTVVGLSTQRWFGWDGGNDYLWAQSVRPIVASDEMNASAEDLRRALGANAQLVCEFEQVFVRTPSAMRDDELLVATGKALAAYQEGLSLGRSAFDRFRDALADGDQLAMAAYPRQARRGLKLFVGYARCSLCHFGPAFTNGEFDSVGISHFLGPGKVDRGRFGGLQDLQASALNRLGRFNDDPQAAPGIATRHVASHPRTFGQFKVPSLRNVAQTAPYMHAGSHQNLQAVVAHYNDINVDRLHADGELVLRPLGLSETDVDALVAFLESLSGPLIDSTPADPSPCP